MRALAIAGCLLLSLAARADDPGVVPLTLAVGQTVPLGPAPIRNLICDDTAVVGPVDSPDGTALRGKTVGTTLCSFTDAFSVRRVTRVTVVPSTGPGSAPDTGTPRSK
jgi:hypothetical protein